MTSDTRFVLDSGVIVSAVLLPQSIPRQAVDLAFARGIVLASPETIDELDQVFRRPKFNPYLREEEQESPDRVLNGSNHTGGHGPRS